MICMMQNLEKLSFYLYKKKKKKTFPSRVVVCCPIVDSARKATHSAVCGSRRPKATRYLPLYSFPFRWLTFSASWPGQERPTEDSRFISLRINLLFPPYTVRFFNKSKKIFFDASVLIFFLNYVIYVNTQDIPHWDSQPGSPIPLHHSE